MFCRLGSTLDSRPVAVMVFWLMAGAMIVTVAVPVVMVFVAAAVSMVMMGVRFPGADFKLRFYGAGQLLKHGKERVGILGPEPKLAGGKYNNGFFHFRACVKFCFDFGGTVGTIQILEPIKLLHGRSSYINKHMSKRSTDKYTILDAWTLVKH